MKVQAWVAKAARQPMVLEPVELGPLGCYNLLPAGAFCLALLAGLAVFGGETGRPAER